MILGDAGHQSDVMFLKIYKSSEIFKNNLFKKKR